MKLNYKQTILIGFAFFSICAFWQFYDNEIPKILKYTFGMKETMTGLIMSLDNILALFLLPLFGRWSDHTDTRIGKRMPFILIGNLLACIFLLILGHLTQIGPFIFCLVLLLLAMGIYRSPAVSLMADLTPAPLRSQGNAIINLMGALGCVCTLFLIKVLLHKNQYMPLILSLVLLMFISILILFVTVPEKKRLDEMETQPKTVEEKAMEASKGKKMPEAMKRSLIHILLAVFFWYSAYNAVTTAYSRYAQQVWHLQNGAYADCLMVGTVAAVLSYLPVGHVAQKIGRKPMILFGIGSMTLAYGMAAFMGTYSHIMMIWFVFVGIGWAAINVNSYPMVVEMSQAGDIGLFTGLYYTFSMAAQVFTPIASGFLLEHVGYQTLFPYAFVFMILAGMTMLRVHHGDMKK
ncbi:MFS transporter [Absicoccus porci]|uniref:MFS transporter n=1 Tax=Absicoccus porci TaxID=2486576 RepID=UPI00240A3634|nr:MFS transporter [Absicoccus porci]MDD6460641.1 MFS transporter [Absicoccus porci]MEE1355730.1 MFS transporter [Absicoccus porci]